MNDRLVKADFSLITEFLMPGLPNNSSFKQAVVKDMEIINFAYLNILYTDYGICHTLCAYFIRNNLCTFAQFHFPLFVMLTCNYLLSALDGYGC